MWRDFSFYEKNSRIELVGLQEINKGGFYEESKIDI